MFTLTSRGTGTGPVRDNNGRGVRPNAKIIRLSVVFVFKEAYLHLDVGLERLVVCMEQKVR